MARALKKHSRFPKFSAARWEEMLADATGSGRSDAAASGLHRLISARAEIRALAPIADQLNVLIRHIASEDIRAVPHVAVVGWERCKAA
jgi:hypothetical protein